MDGFPVWVTILLLDMYFGRALTLTWPCEIRGNVFSLNLLCLVFKCVLVVCPSYIGCPYTRALSTNLSVCLVALCMCVFTVKAPMVVLCLQFCVTTKVEGLSSNSFHILLKVYQHSCCCCSSPASYLHSGSIMQRHHSFARMVLNALLSLTVSKQDPTRLYGWNLCS